MFATVINLIIAGKAGRLALEWYPIREKLQPCLHIRLDYKWMAVANSLAYYVSTITAVKSFIVQAIGVSVTETLAGKLECWSPAKKSIVI